MFILPVIKLLFFDFILFLTFSLQSSSLAVNVILIFRNQSRSKSATSEIKRRKISSHMCLFWIKKKPFQSVTNSFSCQFVWHNNSTAISDHGVEDGAAGGRGWWRGRRKRHHAVRAGHHMRHRHGEKRRRPRKRRLGLRQGHLQVFHHK